MEELASVLPASVHAVAEAKLEVSGTAVAIAALPLTGRLTAESEIPSQSPEILERLRTWLPVEQAKTRRVYYFDSPQAQWASLAGSRGFVLVDQCVVLDMLVTFRN